MMSGITRNSFFTDFLREFSCRLPILLLVAFCLFIACTNFDQIRSIVSEEHTAGQILIIFGITGATSIALALLSSLRIRDGGWKVHPFDIALTTIPVLVLSTQVRGAGLLGPVAGLLFAGIGIVFLCKLKLASLNNRRFQLAVLLVVFLIWLSVLISLRLSPVTLPRELGSVAITVLFFSLLLLIFQLAILQPIIGAPVVILALLVFFLNEQDHDIRLKDFTNYEDNEQNDVTFRSPVSIQDAFDKWLASRNDLQTYRDTGLYYPVFLIASEGGGGYAAAHALLFLSKMQERCPNFAQHVFAITGVSGGAVGNALFWSALKEEDRNPNDNFDCTNSVNVSDELDLLATDNLSPVVAAMLFRDLPNKLLLGLIPGPNRSEVLVKALSHSDDPGSRDNPFYWEHYWELAEDGTRRQRGGPAVLPIATNLVSGKPYIFSPFEIDDLRNGFEQSSCGLCDLSRTEPDEVGLRTYDLGFFDAAVASASFPYVTPSLGLGAFGGSRIGLVDGGYLDNSGSEVLLEIARALHSPNRFFDGASPANLEFPKNTSDAIETRVCYGGLYDGLDISVAKRPYERLNPDHEEFTEEAEERECAVGVRFFTITIRSEPTRERYLEKQSFFTDPVSALLNGRSRRAELARLRLFDFQCAAGPICPRHVENGASIGFLDSVIRPQDFSLPLGWKLPREGLEMMSKVIAPGPNEEIEENYDILSDQRSILAWQADVFESVSGNPYSVQTIIDALNP